MSTLADIAPSGPVSLEQAEDAAAHLPEQLERARRVVADFREVLGEPATDGETP
ncbi:hypothetical protein [Brevundimonas sp.]|uniref:hypothetical protein n=1 Tax=Brevundimonas sp. TaxID=1871086 RepID=UPI002EDA6CC7